jgi:hypothetical protein
LIAVLFASTFAVVAPVAMRTSISFHHRFTVRRSRVSAVGAAPTRPSRIRRWSQASSRELEARRARSCSLASHAEAQRRHGCGEHTVFGQVEDHGGSTRLPRRRLDQGSWFLFRTND